MNVRVSVEELDSKLDVIRAAVTKILKFRGWRGDVDEAVSEAYIDLRRAARQLGAPPRNLDKWIQTVAIRAAQRMMIADAGLREKWKGKQRVGYVRAVVLFTDADRNEFGADND